MDYANAAIGAPTTAAMIKFDHAALFSPALSTLNHALANHWLLNFPGLSSKALRKHPPQSLATTKGHLDQQRMNQRSTKTTSTVSAPHDDETSDLTPTGIDERSHYCFAATYEATGQIFTDQTGRFVTPSSRGNNYIIVLYDYDSNHIFVQPIKNCQAQTILDGFKTLHSRLCKAGLRPKLQRLDNECSDILKDYMKEERIDYQLVPNGLHRRNAAERAIRTFKNHFIVGLCSVDPQFPLHLWDRLLPQAELTLNLSQNRNSTKAKTTPDDLPDLIAPGDDDSSDEESDTEPTARPIATAK
jgi:hypothetical protein